MWEEIQEYLGDQARKEDFGLGDEKNFMRLVFPNYLRFSSLKSLGINYLF